MTKLFKLSLKYAKENQDYHDTDGVDVPEVFRHGYKNGVEDFLKLLRSEDAKAQKHCNENIQKLFGQTPQILANWLESELNGK